MIVDGSTDFQVQEYLAPEIGRLGKLTSEVVSTDVVELSTLDQSPDVLTLQVLEVVVVGSTEVSAERAVVASDDYTALSGRDLGVDAVLDAETDLLDGVTEGGGVLVVTDTTEVDDAVGGQDVLGTTGGVLGGTTSNQLGVVVVEQVLVERGVLLLGQDGIVVLEAVLVEQSLVTNGLDIWRDMSELEHERELVQHVMRRVQVVSQMCKYRCILWSGGERAEGFPFSL